MARVSPFRLDTVQRRTKGIRRVAGGFWDDINVKLRGSQGSVQRL
jgi:hypothetical protein